MATITGYFPASDLPILRIGSEYSGYYVGGKNGATYYPFTNSNGFGDAQFLVDQLRDRYADQTNRSPHQFNAWHVGPFSVTSTGTPNKPPDSRVLVGPVIRSNNKPFKRRVADGDIVVSHYQRSKAVVEYFNGGSGSTPTVHYFARALDHLAVFWTPDYWEAFGTQVRVIGPGSIRFGSYPWGSADNCFYCPYYFKTIGDELTAYDVGWDDDHVRKFLTGTNFMECVSFEERESLVTSTIGDANKSTFDVLTTLAELPETINSIKSLVLQVISMFVDARKGHVRILEKAHKVKREKIEMIERVNFESHSAWVAAKTKRQRSIIERDRRAKVKQLKLDLRETLKEFASAVANVWLTYRYGIEPNVIAVDDAIEASTRALSEYLETKNTRPLQVDAPAMPGFKANGQLTAILRCFDKRKFETAHMAKIPYSGNVSVTLFELVPFSFVGDWVSNVGDRVAAFSSNTSLAEYIEATTLSVKLTGSITYIHPATQAGATVEYTCYKRQVIDSRDYCALNFGLDMSIKRQLDAIALSWSLFVPSALKRLK